MSRTAPLNSQQMRFPLIIFFAMGTPYWLHCCERLERLRLR